MGRAPHQGSTVELAGGKAVAELAEQKCWPRPLPAAAVDELAEAEERALLVRVQESRQDDQLSCHPGPHPGL